MKDFLEKSLRTETIIEDVSFDDRLPLMYSALYAFKRVKMQNVEWLIAVPKEQINLSKLRKHHKLIEKLLNLHCAIFLKDTSPYSKNTMISDGIPFIIQDREIFLPFLGILLSASNERYIKPVQKLSFLAQKIILIAIYNDWQEINVTESAKRLEITRMSASRCFDEIEFFDMPLLGIKGKSRVISVPEDKKKLWENIAGVLRNPVIATFYVGTDLRLPVKGGLSALADYSMIEDNSYPTYIVAKKDISSLGLKDIQIDVKRKIPGCVIQEVGYIIPYKDDEDMDPLSLSLSVPIDEKADVRIEKAVREMLEEYVW